MFNMWFNSETGGDRSFMNPVSKFSSKSNTMDLFFCKEHYHKEQLANLNQI